MPNALAAATSPYLLQHRDNPVDWHPWSPAVLARAEAEGKPLLLSIGYAACHWCHVMAHESFEDASVARLMNENFVCVKVDREERPDLDHIYQTALAAMGEQGGWPLTMFLRPDGTPFWGGTYFPPEPRWGRPGFPQILDQITRIYRDSPEKVRQSTDAISSALGAMDRGSSGGGTDALSFATLDDAAHMLAQAMDPGTGGFRGAPKFPHPIVLDFLWRAHLRTGNQVLGTAVTLTLDRMCQGGIYDHLGGGFSRYATDEAWLVPHFEKMLYDNALLIGVLSTVWRRASTPLYETRVRETVAWALAEMTAPGGGFVSSYDADSEGQEGRFYVWTAAEIAEILGKPAARVFAKAYGVTAAGNWEGRSILNRSERPELGYGDHEAALAAMRQKLFKARARRVPPGRDDKVLADWNGMMIQALVAAWSAFGEDEWLAAAEAAFAHICTAQSDGPHLLHSALDGRAAPASFLDDYAAMAGAALALFEATGAQDYLDRAKGWIAVLDDEFWDPERGGYYLSPAGGERLILRPRHAMDTAVPSGNGMAADVLARLYALTGDDAYRQRAQDLLQAFGRAGARDGVALASLMMGFETLQASLQIAVIGAREDPATAALVNAARAAAPPHRVLLAVPPGANFPPTHPAFGKSQLDGKATAYVCIHQVCSPPISDPDAFADALKLDFPKELP